MSQGTVWQTIGKGSGGFLMSSTFSHIERDILRIMEKMAGKRFTIDDIVGTRSVRRFADERDVYGGSMRLGSDYERRVDFRYRRDKDVVTVVICYEEWGERFPHRDLRIHVRRFSRTDATDFTEIPLPVGTHPFSQELWLGKPAPFDRHDSWLRQHATFVFA